AHARDRNGEFLAPFLPLQWLGPIRPACSTIPAVSRLPRRLLAAVDPVRGSSSYSPLNFYGPLYRKAILLSWVKYGFKAKEQTGGSAGLRCGGGGGDFFEPMGDLLFIPREGKELESGFFPCSQDQRYGKVGRVYFSIQRETRTF